MILSSDDAADDVLSTFLRFLFTMQTVGKFYSQEHSNDFKDDVKDLNEI